MKIFLLVIGIIAFTSEINAVHAQGFDNSEALAYVDITDYETPNHEYNSNLKLSNSKAERIAKAEAYDKSVSPEFGSYLNPYNGNLNIVNDNQKQFTKAQFLKESSNKTVFSITINSKIRTIDISKFDTGSYILILSNDAGDIHVENFIII